MRDQFFGKPFWIGLGIIILTFCFSIVGYLFGLSWLLLAVAALAVIIASSLSPVWGLGGVFLELFSNPHGHLLFAEGLPIVFSLRMAVLVGFFVGYLIFLFRTRMRLSLWKPAVYFLLPLCAAIGIGLLNGFFSQSVLTAFKDGNAYLYLLYGIPILAHSWSASERRWMLNLFAAGLVWNIIVTLVLLYVFSHFDVQLLRNAYVFIRDIRLAEITKFDSGFYRVFSQTQFFSITGGLLFLTLAGASNWHGKDRWVLGAVLGGTLAITLLSLSRSFWVGLVVAILWLFIRALYKKTPASVWRASATLGAFSVLFSIVWISIAVFFPFPSQHIGLGDVFDAVSHRTKEDVAISSRWKLIGPMTEAIYQHPLIGHGFGSVVSFISDDPRVREIHPDGSWSTGSMEWGWLELWLKMGLMGPLGFLWLIGNLFRGFFHQTHLASSWIGDGFMAGLLFLTTTHLLSPYLNHPIGLGYLLLAFVFLDRSAVVFQKMTVPAHPDIRKEKLSMSSALSLQAEPPEVQEPHRL
ncbi:O-antigen ligase family protein [Candidatus Uhrbacteria bacterium]|nr:O-antigen ligase family protein [Candidatus Uhrbacteria bacterium]